MTGDGQRLAYTIASTLLCYPDERVRGRLPDVVAALPQVPLPACRDPLADVAAWLGRQPPGAAERHHVEVFDLTRRCSPYLTYYRYGDTRQRGMALLALKHTYRRAGVEPAGPELPDYLPVVLEFAALTGDPGVRLLDGNRAALQLMRLALHDLASPYAHLLDAIAACLPPLSVSDRSEVARLAREGPPEEVVGLEPYGPPETTGVRV